MKNDEFMERVVVLGYGLRFASSLLDVHVLSGGALAHWSEVAGILEGVRVNMDAVLLEGQEFHGRY